MSVFNLFLETGIKHILDINGFDHILFILTLCAVYSLKQWKNVLVLITAFTIGHSLTLVLATFNIINLSSELVELLIAITILLTALSNIISKSSNFSVRFFIVRYFISFSFGLIHGLGFSTFLRSMLGSQSSILKPLFAFNVGIEIGQLIIVISMFLIIGILSFIIKSIDIYKKWILSIVSIIISAYLIVIRFPINIFLN